MVQRKFWVLEIFYLISDQSKGPILCVLLSVLDSKLINLLVSRWDFQIRVLASLKFYHLPPLFLIDCC